jgi:hypothetical protein
MNKAHSDENKFIFLITCVIFVTKSMRIKIYFIVLIPSLEGEINIIF